MVQPQLLSNNTVLTENRAKPRIKCSYPASIQHLDRQGNKCLTQGRVVNLSASGILLVTKRGFRNNAEVHVKVAFSTGALEWDTSRLAAKGTVIRNELQADGAIGIAIRFQDYNFI